MEENGLPIISSYEELDELYKTRNKMEKHIRYLWDDVIVCYLNNYNNREIFNNLTINDYDKFYKWMLYNNNNYQYVCDRIEYLENI